ncbi:hypothetical protein C4D60_Mb11t01410 [Musa balbisiana]|uniref:WPP domain-containing protein n=1 Tax=Musa balbisiana TaxID=52838 RepID=A0A4V4H572_MUSBA|nr:hypothetical protein C4D60_Mb11t01410 [Musa balbisiana]
MTKNLSSESIFSRKYGLLSKEEAYENAKRIEDECFIAASEHFQKEPDGDGSSAVQFYARETSKQMLEVLKRGPERKEHGEVVAVDRPVKPIEIVFDISEIYISYLNLEDEGTIAIANTLKQSVPLLEVLDIAGNEITTKAAPALAECIAVKKSLRTLILSENELKDQGAVLIGRALEEGHTQLKELDVSVNMLRRVGARCLAQAVSNKPDFKLLNINGNAISDEGIDEVKEILKNGSNSVDVLGPLDENDVEEEGEDGEEEEGGGAAAEGEGELESKLHHLKVEQD